MLHVTAYYDWYGLATVVKSENLKTIDGLDNNTDIDKVNVCCYQDQIFQDQDQKVQDQDLVSSNKVNATTEDRPTNTIIPNLYPVT